MNAFVDDLIQKAGLQIPQAEGVVGLVLSQAKKNLSGADFSKVMDLIPQATALLAKAPADGGGGLLGGLAGSLGGGKAQALMALSQGLKKLNISPDKIGEILSTLKSTAAQSYPQLLPLLEKALG